MLIRWQIRLSVSLLYQEDMYHIWALPLMLLWNLLCNSKKWDAFLH